MSKKKKYIICFTIVAIILFIGTYLCFIKYNSVKNHRKSIYENSSSVMNKSEFKDGIKSSTKLIFKTVYLKSGEIKKEEHMVEEYDKEIIGYNKEKLNSYFLQKGYKLESFSNDEVIVMKNIDRYSPNKYIIGIQNTKKGEYMAIFRTDKDGKMYIENKEDITNVKINMLGKDEIKILKEGSIDFQFDTKDKATEAITEYQS